MEMIGFGFSFFVLIAGIVLTVITIRRMITGSIAVSGWTRAFLITGMILLHLVLLISLLPPMDIDNIFVNEYTDSAIEVYPDSSVNEVAP